MYSECNKGQALSAITNGLSKTTDGGRGNEKWERRKEGRKERSLPERSSPVMHNKDKWHITGIDAEICTSIRK